KPVEIGLPSRLIGKVRDPGRCQTSNHRSSQAAAAYGVERGFVQHIIAMTGAQQIAEVQPALGETSAKPSEAVVADLRAEAVFRPMPRAGVIERYPRRVRQPGAQHSAGFIDKAPLALGQQTLHFPL